MARIYFYKLTADNGGAPCVQGGLLSLAICKPMIRSSAEPGDLVFGFAANSLDRNNRLIYVARITSKVRDGQYFTSKRFRGREDCVYERRGGRFAWRHGAAHHGPRHLLRDLGKPPEHPRANVLLSTDFRYFGGAGTAEYKETYPGIRRAVEGLGRGHRVKHEGSLRNELMALWQEVRQGTRVSVAGRPTSAPRRDVCHRARSCGIVDVPEATTPREP